MEFKCIYHDEPVGECPPVKELARLRQENRELRERIRELREGQAPPLHGGAGAGRSQARPQKGGPIMFLTTENAKEYLGKKLDADHRVFHYYPLTVGIWASGQFYYQDRHGVCMPVPTPQDRFTRIWFDTST
jgi:hypothetical protein